MLRFILLAILVTLVARAFWRVVDGLMEGLRGNRVTGGATTTPLSVQMARDPVCGTYVVPSRAVVLLEGSRQIFFCSASCRDKYRATASDRREPVEGRTA